jgi:aryl-alcohol dehydrogenase-like predicted oxidoreductase
VENRAADRRVTGASPSPGALDRLKLSRICFGTMRLPDRSPAEVAELIEHALALGIDTFHCSTEYATFPLLQEAWSLLRSRSAGVKLIGKVGVPHFGEDRFSKAALVAKVDTYLSALRTDHLHVLQWLLRYDLKQEEARLRILEESREEVAEVVAELKQAGKISAFVGFPYTIPVAERLLGSHHCDGLAVYVNPLEHEMDDLVTAAAAVHKGVLAIRPFAAGKFLETPGSTADQALAHVFGFPAVQTAIVSASSRQHLDELSRWVQTGITRAEPHVLL